MAEAWDYFQTTYPESYQWLLSQSFLRADETPSIECLSDALEVARVEWERVNRRGRRKLLAASADVQRTLIKAALLSETWWNDPASVDEPDNGLAAHRTVVQKVCATRQPGQGSPWFFTTNYDLAIEWAAEAIGLHVTGGFSGLHHRAFASHNFDLGFRNVLARGEARFGTYNICLAKLHGSLTWRILPTGLVIEESAAAARDELFDFLSGAGKEPQPFVVYPRTAKYRQTAEYVLGELFRRFTEMLSRPQTGLVVCGYSFADEHINRVLRAALNNPTLQIVLYVRSARWEEDRLVIPDGTPWARRLANLKLPQVTIVGGGDTATFGAFAEHLPDPTVLDSHALQIRKQLREWEAWERDGRRHDQQGETAE